VIRGRGLGAIGLVALAWALLGALAPSSARAAEAVATVAPERGFAVTATPGWVDEPPAPLEAETPTRDVEDGKYYLFADRQVRFGPEETYRRTVVRLLDSEGVSSSCEPSFTFDPTFQTLALHHARVHRDGRVIDKLDLSKVRTLERESDLERRILDGRRQVVLILEDVRPNDVLDYAWSIRGDSPLLEGRILDGVVIDRMTPIERLRDRIILPAGNRAAYRAIGERATEPVMTDRPDGRELIWDRRRPEPTPYESSLPDRLDLFSWVQISDAASWAEVAAWATPLYSLEAPLDEDVGALARSIELETSRPDERVRRALRRVQEDVRYLGMESGAGGLRPSRPGVVYARRFGDCKDKSLLLCSILRAMGFDARPALVDTDRRGDIDRLLPSPFAFDHCVVRVEVAGVAFWLDPTLPRQDARLSALPPLPYERALVVSPTSIALETMAAPEAPLDVEVREHLHLPSDPSRPARFTVTTRYFGARAESESRAGRSSSRAERTRRFTAFYAETWPNVTPTAEARDEYDEERNVFTVSESYSIGDIWARIDPEAPKECEVTSPGFMDYLPSVASARRSRPYAFDHPNRFRVELDVDAAAGLTFREDMNLDVDEPAFRIRMRRFTSHRRLSFRGDFSSKAESIAPQEVIRHANALERVRRAAYYSLTLPDKATLAMGWDTAGRTPDPPTARGRLVISVVLGSATGLAAALLLRRIGRRRSGISAPAVEGPSGIRGWLLVAAFTLLMTPVLVANGLISAAGAVDVEQWALRLDPGVKNVIPYAARRAYVEILFCLFALPVTFSAIPLFFRRRAAVPAVAATLLAICAVFWMAEILLSLPLVDDGDGRQVIAQTFPRLFVTIVWLVYFLRSRRVYATFRE